MSIEAYRQIQEERKVLQERIDELGRTAFAEASAEIFAKHPLLVSFEWKQYTDYFNDGDTCTFSVRSDWGMNYEFGDPDEPVLLEDFEGMTYCENEWALDNREAVAAATEAAVELINSFDEDDLEELFGDHVCVTVNKDGVEVSDYSDHE